MHVHENKGDEKKNGNTWEALENGLVNSAQAIIHGFLWDFWTDKAPIQQLRSVRSSFIIYMAIFCTLFWQTSEMRTNCSLVTKASCTSENEDKRLGYPWFFSNQSLRRFSRFMSLFMHTELTHSFVGTFGGSECQKVVGRIPSFKLSPCLFLLSLSYYFSRWLHSRLTRV